MGDDDDDCGDEVEYNAYNDDDLCKQSGRVMTIFNIGHTDRRIWNPEWMIVMITITITITIIIMIMIMIAGKTCNRQRHRPTLSQSPLSTPDFDAAGRFFQQFL